MKPSSQRVIVQGTAQFSRREILTAASRAAGRADREAGRPVREDEVFRLASMTKAIVRVAALALVDRGHLRLEDPVTRWLPDFRPKLADGREPAITIRHLTTHMAGLTYGFPSSPNAPYHRLGVSDGLDASELALAETCGGCGSRDFKSA